MQLSSLKVGVASITMRNARVLIPDASQEVDDASIRLRSARGATQLSESRVASITMRSARGLTPDASQEVEDASTTLRSARDPTLRLEGRRHLDHATKLSWSDIKRSSVGENTSAPLRSSGGMTPGAAQDIAVTSTTL